MMTSTSKPLRRVAVFCGSAFGNNPAFRAEATALGTAIAKAGIGLVYGGACRGLMGAVADAALAAGGEVIGVLPEALSGREIAHNGLTSLELVSTMHERKARIHELSDAILALPGGYRHARRIARGDYLGANRTARQAVHPDQHAGLLERPAGVSRHGCGRPASLKRRIGHWFASRRRRRGARHGCQIRLICELTARRYHAVMSTKLRFGVLSTANIGLKKVIPAMQQGRADHGHRHCVARFCQGPGGGQRNSAFPRPTDRTRNCSPTPTSTPSTIRCPISSMFRGPRRPPKPASTCSAKSR